MTSPPPPPPPPVGEDNWVDYVDQQRRRADTLEKRIHVIELYRSAVNAEAGSVRVWVAYCNYFWSLHQDCQRPHGDVARWSHDELAAARDIFSLDAALHLWSEGHDATKYRLSDSHVLWDRWIALEKELLDRTRTPVGVQRITHLYRNRLLSPHADWDATAAMFSRFLTEYNDTGYEAIMKDVTERAADAKRLYNARDHMETKLQTAVRSGDPVAEKNAMAYYLGWEIANTKKERKDQASAIHLALGLFSRALTGILASDETTWADFIVYVSHLRGVFGGGPRKNDELSHLLPNALDILQRAVQHCPWSGSLWARYVLAGEEAGLAFADMERIKHAATNSSQLDRDGMTGVVDMYAAWCGYLKRSAMHLGATDEAVDVADSGMVAALEAVQVWGERKFGDAYQGDPKFRLERILIQYLTEKHAAIDDAREQWKSLAAKELYTNSYDFWLTYYMWEMLVFQGQKGKGRSPTPGASANKGLRVPTVATAVLEQAVYNRNMDWPERVMEVYLHHCNDYETPEVLRQALDTVHKVKQTVARRREQEAAEAAAAYAAQTQAQQEAAEAGPEASPSAPKRKRENSPEDPAGGGAKRQKNTENSTAPSQQDGHDQRARRDRENTSVFVTNLPVDTTGTKVKQYFKDYGHVNNLHVRKEQDGKSNVAYIEFRSPEDVKSALIRDGKYFGEQQISVKAATNLTVFVTNFPPTADDAYIRDVFKDCGEVFSIRWPSLKFNTHRRFCYVTFRDVEAAAKATKLDGTMLEGRYKLSALYSDPSAKKAREGATSEGREVHITNLGHEIDEDFLGDVCAKYGTVERVKILRGIGGKSRGSAFVSFGQKDEAERAATELDKTKLGSQILKAEIAAASNYKPTARTTGAASPSSAPSERDDEGNETVADAPRGGTRAAPSERSLALLDIPDTVNVSRVRVLVEPHGEIVKLVLRPDHGGAIVEMADAAAAGKVQLALDGVEIDGGKLRTGTVASLFHGKKPKPDDKAPDGRESRAAADAKAAALMPPPPRVKRPGANKQGAKRGLGFGKPARAGSEQAVNGTDDRKTGAPTKKTNADFRSLILGQNAGGKEGEAKEPGIGAGGGVQNGH